MSTKAVIDEVWEMDRGNVVRTVTKPAILSRWPTTEHATIASCAPEALRMLRRIGCQDIACNSFRCRPDCEWTALMTKADLL